MEKYVVIGIKLDQRRQSAQVLQELLSQNGCNIKARIGLHETGEDFCAEEGIILLHTYGEEETLTALFNALKAIEHATVKMMDLNR